MINFLHPSFCREMRWFLFLSLMIVAGFATANLKRTEEATNRSPLLAVIVHQDMVTHAEVRIRVEAIVEMNEGEEITTESEVKDPRGYAVTGSSEKISSGEKSKKNSIHTLFLPHPLLWQGRDNPYLHTVIVRLKKGEKVISSKEMKVGFRKWEKAENGRYLLNGHYVEGKELMDINMCSSPQEVVDKLFSGEYDKEGQFVRLIPSPEFLNGEKRLLLENFAAIAEVKQGGK